MSRATVLSSCPFGTVYHPNPSGASSHLTLSVTGHGEPSDSGRYITRIGFVTTGSGFIWSIPDFDPITSLALRMAQGETNHVQNRNIIENSLRIGITTSSFKIVELNNSARNYTENRKKVNPPNVCALGTRNDQVSESKGVLFLLNEEQERELSIIENI
ncbi:MAG: hypothetical protein HGB18_05405 [Candidatus Moranbacteria bacterium]|nr:hypothetical protein [Candidatus Moranbacteria bacterium]